MKLDEYQRMAEMERKYWWHVGRLSIVRRQLRLYQPASQQPQKILNIGSGTGGTIPMLSEFGELYNVDTSPQAIRYMQDRNVNNIVLVEGLKLPWPDNYFDTVVALDVLEHIDQDQLALREWYRVLKQDGRILITVPAYQWLWSGHDDSLHHHRRYTASGLHQLLTQSRFQVLKRSYTIVFSFPLILGYRLLQSILGKAPQRTSYVILPSLMNRIFILLLQFEGWMLRYLSMPFGTSVLMIGKKT